MAVPSVITKSSLPPPAKSYAPNVRDSDIGDAYNSCASAYIEKLGHVDQMADLDRGLIARWRDSTQGCLLDAGCGPGHWTNFLHNGDREVVGVDLASAFLAEARCRYPQLDFVHGSFFELPVPTSSRDGILAWYSIIHAAPSSVPDILHEFGRCLKPSGSLLLGFFDGETGKEFPHAITPAYFWSIDSLTSTLHEAGFAVLEQYQRHNDGHRPHAALWARLDDSCRTHETYRG